MWAGSSSKHGRTRHKDGCKIGRKNFLFLGSENGGKTAAILFSLVETCKQNDIDSLAYLTDVLKRLPNHPYQRVSELLPHHWKPPQKTESAA
jgi:transposase